MHLRWLAAARQGGDLPLLLIVEDDAGVAEALMRFLAGHDMRCVIEPSFEDAREALRDLQFLDVPVAGLLTDFDLPDGNGCEVVRAFRRSFPDLPVAIMSGSADIVTTGWMQEQRVTLLPKPFTLDDLRTWIGGVLAWHAFRSPLAKDR
ncbi:MAG: response regulator [Planctomycetota bacterium]|nr:response regulator [Planctomycetota bacterium]